MNRNKIQLNFVVNDDDKGLLGYGISYYTWVKTRSRNCYYLMPLKRRELFIRISAGIISLIAVWGILIMSLYNNGGLFAVLSFGVICSVVIIAGGGLYYRSFTHIINQLPSSPILIADLDKGYLKVRNLYKLPFLQVPEKRWKVNLDDLEYVRMFAAYKIHNMIKAEWSYFGYSPSWKSLSICSESPEGKDCLQLLFVGRSIPFGVCSFFHSTLKLKLERDADYSRFEK